MKHAEDSWIVFVKNAVIGLLTWLGGITADGFSDIMAGLSYAAGAIWFATQTYLAWRNRKPKE